MGNYYLYRIAYSIARALPLRVAYAIAVFFADCHYLLSFTDRRSVRANLQAILKSDHVPSGMVRDVFRNFGKYLAEFFTMTQFLNDDFMKTKVHLTGTENLNEVLKYGKGGIVVSAHLGNWEMAGGVMSLLGYPMSVVALSHRDPRVNKFFNDQREFFGTTVIPTTTAIRLCMQHAQANRLVALLSERDFSEHGLVMDFLGKPTRIPKGAALFSLKTGAPVIPCFFMRGAKGDFIARYEKPIYPPAAVRGKVSDEELGRMIVRYTGVIEEQIRKDPAQWLMFRKFWVE